MIIRSASLQYAHEREIVRDRSENLVERVRARRYFYDTLNLPVSYSRYMLF